MAVPFRALCVLLLAAIASSARALVVFHVSDIHLDPYYASPSGVYHWCRNATLPQMGALGCDTPISLLEGVVAELGRQIDAAVQGGESVALLYTGDWVRHNTQNLTRPHADMASIFAQAAATLAPLAKAVVLGPVALALGNEDFYPDYNATADAAALTVGYAQVLAADGLLPAAAVPTMAQCGYYAGGDAGGYRFLVLNTVLYSTESNATGADPCGQLAWLQSQLKEAAADGLRVLLVAHIPPVMGLWREAPRDAFNAIVAAFKDTVAAHIYGHTHMTVPFVGSSGLLLVGGSVTLVSGTVTCFQRYLLADPAQSSLGTAPVLSWQQHRAAPPALGAALAWAAVDVAQALALPNVSASGIAAMAEGLRTNQTLLPALLAVAGAGMTPHALRHCTSPLFAWACRIALSCAIQHESLLVVAACGVTNAASGDPAQAQVVKDLIASLAAAHNLVQQGRLRNSVPHSPLLEYKH